MPVTKDSSAPYAPTRAIMEIVSRYRAKGLPSPINSEVLGRVGISDSLISRTLQALQTLDLIDEKGMPTGTFEGLRLAPENEYKQRLSEWLNSAYADVLAFVNPGATDETALRDAFRNYSPVGQRDRMVTLFVGLFAAAGIGAEKAKVKQSRPSTSDAQKAPRRRFAPTVNQDSKEKEAEKQPGQKAKTEQKTEEQNSFEKDILAKFPSFDPSWSEDLKAKWFEGFAKFMAMVSPKP